MVVTALVAIAVSNLTLVWMQLAADKQETPAPATAVTPVPDQTPEPTATDPLPEDPESRERNMQDIFSAMKRHLPEGEQ